MGTESDQQTQTTGQTSSPTIAPSSGGSGDGDYSISSFMQEAKEDLSKEAGELEGHEIPIEETPEQNPQQGELPLQPPATPAKPARILDGLDENEQWMFKNMANKAYEHLYPAYKEYKELKAQKDKWQADLEQAKNAQWWQNENAWTLHPEYQEAKGTFDTLTNIEIPYWEEQLAKVEAGQPYNRLGMDAQGRLIRGQECPASPQEKAFIIRQIMQAQQYATNAENQLKNFSGQFKGRYESLSNNLNALNKRVFGDVDFNVQHKESYNRWLNEFPAEVRHQTAYQLLAKSGVVIENLIRRLQAAEGKKVVQTAVAATARNGGSTASATAAPSKLNDTDLDDYFARVTRRPMK